MKVIVERDDGTREEYTNFILAAIDPMGDDSRIALTSNWGCSGLNVAALLAAARAYVDEQTEEFARRVAGDVVGGDAKYN